MDDLKSSNNEKKDGLKEFLLKIIPYIHILLKNKWKIVIINFIASLFIAGYLYFLIEPYYDCSINILPEYGNKSGTFSSLASLASMAGIRVGDMAPTAIYEKLLYSESVIKNVVYKKYKTEKFPDSVNLIAYFEIGMDEKYSGDLAKRAQFIKIYEIFTRGIITTGLDRMTDVLLIQCRMPEAQLSADVVNELVLSLDNYIRTQRKSYATEQVDFIEKRVAEISDSLFEAEVKLKKFRELNRVTIQSPQLILEQSRMMRAIEIYQTVYLELVKQLELARIDQVKDTPVLNIQEHAQNPIKRAGPKRMTNFIILMFVFFTVTCLYFIYQDKIIEIKKIIKSYKKK